MFYVVNRQTLDAARFDMHGHFAGWDSTIRWEHATGFRSEAAALHVRNWNLQLNREHMSNTTICKEI